VADGQKKGSLVEAKGLLKQATTGLLKIRNDTPAGSYEDFESLNELQAQVGAFGDQVDLAAKMAITNGGGVEFAEAEVYPVWVLYQSVDADLITGRLPRDPEDPQGVPGKDPATLQMQAMRADAADYEAEEATNGYEEVPDAQDPDRDAQGG